jgi:hypothetical protein
MPSTPKLNITRSITQGDLNPVGMIVQSMLTEAQFQALNGTSWVLMDGRSVTGSTYSTVTGSNTIPDARGMVLRGKNNGRSDGSQNPDGDSSLGAYQGDLFGQHQHTGRGNTFDAGFPLAGGQAGLATDSGLGINANSGGVGGTRVRPTTAAYDPSGGNETRMRNITVNHFIKIN